MSVQWFFAAALLLIIMVVLFLAYVKGCSDIRRFHRPEELSSNWKYACLGKKTPRYSDEKLNRVVELIKR